MLPDNVLFSQTPAGDLKRFSESKSYSKIVALVDENTEKACLPSLTAIGFDAVISVASGEEHKTLDTCASIWEQMTTLELDRHALMVVVGGGVLGDMGGFCAATYKRGIDFVLVPTTLLAQVDASIGGKLGIDFKTFKNHIGVFQQPALTLIHAGFLHTLPEAELRSGFAEVLKHCLISDKGMWKEITTTGFSAQRWEELIRHSVKFKARITTEDPKEKGIRKILNAGHTIGHAVESYLLGSNRRILHGEAVAIGLVAEAWIAWKKKLLTQNELEEITSTVTRFFGKVELRGNEIDGAAVLTVQDKKNKGQKILCVLPNGIGKALWDIEIDISEVKAALRYYCEVQM